MRSGFHGLMCISSFLVSMSIFLRLPGRFYGAESCKVVSFPLSISHFWKEAGPGGSIPQFFKKMASRWRCRIGGTESFAGLRWRNGI